MLLAGRCDPRCRILSYVPDKTSVHRMNSCRRKIGRCAEDFLYSVGFAGACHQEPNFGGVIQNRQGQGQAVGVKFCDERSDNQTHSFGTNAIAVTLRRAIMGNSPSSFLSRQTGEDEGGGQCVATGKSDAV